jgi:hypothetical protein
MIEDEVAAEASRLRHVKASKEERRSTIESTHPAHVIAGGNRTS